MKENKLLFFDIDGTLSYPGHTVSARVADAIRQARKNGHLAFICTGRPIDRIQKEIQEIGFDGVIASAGGYVKLGEELISQTFIPDPVVDVALEVFQKFHMFCDIETENGIYSNTDVDEFYASIVTEEELAHNSELARVLDFHKQTKSRTYEQFHEERPGVYKICFTAKAQRDVDVAETLLHEDFHFVRFHFRGQETLFNGEVNYRGISKGSAIEQICARLGRDLSDTVGFGDSMNDYEMIKRVGTGVVMENGEEKLKKIATQVCESVQEDGVYHEMKRLGLI